MDKGIDKTIEKIERDLEENEQPLPKAVPTQFGINTPLSELPRMLFKAECSKCEFKVQHKFQRVEKCVLYIEDAADHCEERRHKLEYTFIALDSGRSIHNEFVPSKRAWTRWLGKLRFFGYPVAIVLLSLPLEAGTPCLFILSVARWESG